MLNKPNARHFKESSRNTRSHGKPNPTMLNQMETQINISKGRAPAILHQLATLTEAPFGILLEFWNPLAQCDSRSPPKVSVRESESWAKQLSPPSLGLNPMSTLCPKKNPLGTSWWGFIATKSYPPKETHFSKNLGL